MTASKTVRDSDETTVPCDHCGSMTHTTEQGELDGCDFTDADELTDNGRCFAA